MTTDTQLAPTDAEIDALIVYFGPTSGLREDSRDLTIKKLRELVRTAIAKWGTPQPVVREPMTHAQAKALVSKYGNDPLHLVYQVEVAHGIKGGKPC